MSQLPKRHLDRFRRFLHGSPCAERCFHVGLSDLILDGVQILPREGALLMGLVPNRCNVKVKR